MNIFISFSKQHEQLARLLYEHLVHNGVAAFVDMEYDLESLADQLDAMIAESQLIVILADQEYFASAIKRQEWAAAVRGSAPKFVIRFNTVELPPTDVNFTVVDCSEPTDAPELLLTHIRSRPSLRLFISYARDDAAHVQALLDVLKKSSSKPWVDTSKLNPGEPFPGRILQAVERCDYFILLWSASSKASRWVENEWNHAFRLNKRVLPILLDSTPLPMVLEGTHAFKSTDDDQLFAFFQVAKARPAGTQSPQRRWWQRILARLRHHHVSDG